MTDDESQTEGRNQARIDNPLYAISVELGDAKAGQNRGKFGRQRNLPDCSGLFPFPALIWCSGSILIADLPRSVLSNNHC